MLSISKRRKLDNWNNDSIRPGIVGSVGDANLNVTFKSTFPGDYREAPYTAGNKEIPYGTNVRDGDVDSPLTGGQNARVKDGYFGGMRDSMTVQNGWVFQNLKPEDMVHEPIMGPLPQYSWRNQVATINSNLRTGEQFKDLPGGYMPVWGGMGKVPRGGNVPGIVGTTGTQEKMRFTYNQETDGPRNNDVQSINMPMARQAGLAPNVNPLRFGNNSQNRPGLAFY